MRSRYCWAIHAKMSRASESANWLAMHVRGPPPKGKNAYCGIVSLLVRAKRSGTKERFALTNKETIPQYASFPFGGGPRTCIASQFALSEARLILACIAQQYRLRIVKDHPVIPQPLITLRARYGIKVLLERR